MSPADYMPIYTFLAIVTVASIVFMCVFLAFTWIQEQRDSRNFWDEYFDREKQNTIASLDTYELPSIDRSAQTRKIKTPRQYIKDTWGSVWP